MVSKLASSSVPKKNGALLSSALGIGWFAVWLVLGAVVLQWTLEHQRELFEFLLPVFFIAWIASLYIGRAALTAAAKKLLGFPDAQSQTQATRAPRAQAEPIDQLYAAYVTKHASNRLHLLQGIEKKERKEISPSSEVNFELTDLGTFALSLTIYVAQQDWRQRSEAGLFLKTAQEVYKESPTKESLLQAWQHAE